MHLNFQPLINYQSILTLLLSSRDYLIRVLLIHRTEVGVVFAQACFPEISFRIQTSGVDGRFSLMFAGVRLGLGIEMPVAA